MKAGLSVSSSNMQMKLRTRHPISHIMLRITAIYVAGMVRYGLYRRPPQT